MGAGRLIDDVIAAGSAAWPACGALAPSLRARIAARLESDDRPEQLDAAEIYLACACATGDATALAIFERSYFASLPAVLGRMSLSAADVAEVLQALRIRLFVTDGAAAPRVVRYAGAGQLGGLVRVAAVRLALNLLRDHGRLREADDGLEALPNTDDDPELVQLKAQCRASFKAAFEDAIQTLAPRERSLLELALVKGLGIDKLAVIYGVHRATAARWLAQARANLTAAVTRLLGGRIGVVDARIDELLPLVESQLELSLERVLRPAGPR